MEFKLVGSIVMILSAFSATSAGEDATFKEITKENCLIQTETVSRP